MFLFLFSVQFAFATKFEFCDVLFVSKTNVPFIVEMTITECFECPPIPISAPILPNTNLWINDTIQVLKKFTVLL